MKPNHTSLEFVDETELQQWLQKQFESYGWRAYRERRPTNSEYRADLIVYHENWGWFGIECKYLSSTRNGKKIGEAIEQILYKYRGERYRIAKQEIDLWAVCPYTKKQSSIDYGTTQTIRETLCHLGIGIIWPGDRMMMDFAYSSSDTKILLGDEEGNHYGDIERIREMVQKKIYKEGDGLGKCQYEASAVGCNADAVDTVEIGNYQIQLCEHHIRDFEMDMWSLEKQARASVNQ